MSRNSYVSTLILALGLLSLSGMAQAGSNNNPKLTQQGSNPGLVLLALLDRNNHESAPSTQGGNGKNDDDHGRNCQKAKRNKHCASPS